MARRPTGPADSSPGQVIAGRYTLIEVLGEGGMGTVYRAEQTQPVKRQVALKLIKIGMDSRAVLARFDAERQALALMDHPNIARVYDGGTTEAGQPFFVMELVNGVPITDYCDRTAAPGAGPAGAVRRRLPGRAARPPERDHPPRPQADRTCWSPRSTAGPLPRSSISASPRRPSSSSPTRAWRDTGAIVGTPTYMSPEQADPSSMDIDTRTDVYALGVILYELLAGSPPIDAKQFKRGRSWRCCGWSARSTRPGRAPR